MNGNGAAPSQTQVNPREAAHYALVFLARADFKAHERMSYAMAEALLNAIAQGQVQVIEPTAVPEPPVLSPVDLPT